MRGFGETKLKSIQKNSIWLQCQCGHSGSIKFEDMLSKKPHFQTVADLVNSTRCSRCGGRNHQYVRITYLGGSERAMNGAEQGMAELPAKRRAKAISAP